MTYASSAAAGFIIDATAIARARSIMSSAATPVQQHIAHAAYESRATGFYPIVTAEASAYSSLPFPLDLEPLP
ncbi:hypothetical protein [Nocardia abscessus]|uniref:hypothetical protein n=1 Tax=Nocardia abscessus TaxID=120957 RepID=UPI002458E434|nr:hypothetical protein [Nocardia abscessus]